MTAAHSPARTPIFIHAVEVAKSITTEATAARTIRATISTVPALSVASPSPTEVPAPAAGVSPTSPYAPYSSAECSAGTSNSPCVTGPSSWEPSG